MSKIKPEHLFSFRVFTGEFSIFILPDEDGCHDRDCLKQAIEILRLRNTGKAIYHLPEHDRIALSLPR